MARRTSSSIPADLVAASSDLAAVSSQVRTLAATQVPVLVRGEPGTGKELLARALHDASPRGKKPFVGFNCGETPPDAVVPRLFGHTARAIPGAPARKGLIEESSGGSLFLDEVEALPIEAQNRLRTLLKRGVIHPLGSTAPRKVDLRLITATGVDLMGRVRAGRFRLELYYLLAVGLVRLPPLRERPTAIDGIVDGFIARSAKSGTALTLTPAARKQLHAQPWHGNVRELQNVLARLAMKDGGPKLDRNDIDEALGDALGPTASDILHRPLSEGFNIDDVVAEVESHYFRLALHQSGGNKARAARLLGLNNSTTLSNRMQKHGLL